MRSNVASVKAYTERTTKLVGHGRASEELMYY